MVGTSTAPQGPPTRIGLILYPKFEVLDVFGPLEALNTISRTSPPFVAPPPAPATPLSVPLTLSIIAQTLEPVPSGEKPFHQCVVPTHTFATAPDDIEVLIVPGGVGDSVEASAFIAQRFAKLRYLFTVCTGANIAARAGVLRGCRATTNKKAWGFVTGQDYSADTFWVADARWVVSGDNTPEGVGKVWTTSGVSAGTDGMISWIAAMYGENVAAAACDWMEYKRSRSDDDRGFAKVWGCQDVPFKRGGVVPKLGEN